jgi:hypothetical protein
MQQRLPFTQPQRMWWTVPGAYLADISEGQMFVSRPQHSAAVGSR